MTNRLYLDGKMIPRTVRRMFDQREEARQPRGGEIVRLEGRRHHAARLLNLSPGGAMIECDGNVRIGESVSLTLTDGRKVPASVQWAAEGRIGLHFASPLE